MVALVCSAVTDWVSTSLPPASHNHVVLLLPFVVSTATAEEGSPACLLSVLLLLGTGVSRSISSAADKRVAGERDLGIGNWGLGTNEI